MNHLFIVGAQRSGSTYLYHLLQDHDEIMMAQPERPEPKFFLLSQSLYSKGREYYENTYFSCRTKETTYCGEKSTSYIESAQVALRIHGFYPEARILMILRNPVNRAYSNYCFSVAHGLEHLSFSQALDKEPDRLQNAVFKTSVNPYGYRRRGHYIDYVQEYLKVFHSDQIRISIFEELIDDLSGVQGLYRWLGVDDTIVPDSFGKVFNPAAVPDEVPVEMFRDLAVGYQHSLEQLESHLGRRIDVWRNHWTTF